MSRADRAKLSRLMMVLGIATTVVGIGIRQVAAATPVPCGAGCGPGPTPGPSTEVSAPPASPGVTAPLASPTVMPSASPIDSRQPGVLWFGDDFDVVAAWPDGTLDWMTTSVVGGQYRIAAQVTDLPIVVMAAAGDGSPDGDTVVTIRLTFASGLAAETGAGLALQGLTGERLLLLVSANGRVSLWRDSIESLDQLASGTIDAPTGSIELALSLGGGTATATVDGRNVASARTAFAPVGFGIAIWAPLEPETIEVDQYRVWVVGPAPQP